MSPLAVLNNPKIHSAGSVKGNPHNCLGKDSHIRSARKSENSECLKVGGLSLPLKSAMPPGVLSGETGLEASIPLP